MITKPLSIGEVSAQTGIAEGTLRYWAHIGRGPRSFKLGRRRVYNPTEVERWMGEQEAAAADERRGGSSS